jgi:hypothetical protein
MRGKPKKPTLQDGGSEGALIKKHDEGAGSLAVTFRHKNGSTNAVHIEKGMRCSDVARWLEFGTVHIGAMNWMTASFEDSKDDALDAIVDTLREELRKLGLQ